MRAFVVAALALMTAGCATAPVYPAVRPLSQEHIDAMAQTPVVVSENNLGVTKSWFMTDSSAAGASYGLIGALVTVAMDAMINAGPSRRARQAADEIDELITAEALDTSLVEQLRAQIPAADVTAPGVSFSEVTTVQRISSPDATEDAIDIYVSYVLSEDASTLRITANASYQNAEMPYQTPYTFSGQMPRPETTGPLYRNTFTFYSDQLPIPLLSPELRERLVASIEASYADGAGNLPIEGSDDYGAMQREITAANDNTLSKPEIAIFLTREWLKDDGALLRSQIEAAHSFIAHYVALDLNSTRVPSITGTDELLETLADQRTVRRMGTGTQAGSYISSPGSTAGFSTYGNAIGIAHANSERMDALRDEARRTRRAH